jgi:flagellar basal body-associated protein FliL
MDDLRNIKPSRPVRKGYGIYIIIAAVVLLAGLGVWWFLTHNNQEATEVKPIPSVEVYAQALSKMNSEYTATFMDGYRMMDSLSRIEYIPAMYEMVRTLGWNSNETSIRRKDMLGIEYDEDNSPIDSTVNNAVLYMADRILEVHDTTQANINMKVAYLMYFYCEGGKFKVLGDNTSQHYLDEAQHWAEFIGDTIFLNTIINTEKSNN